MVKLVEEKEVVEFQNSKLISVCCKHCKRDFGNLKKFNNVSKRNWQIHIDDINWDIDLIFINNEIFCECHSYIGQLVDTITLKLKKRYLEINY